VKTWLLLFLSIIPLHFAQAQNAVTALHQYFGPGVIAQGGVRGFSMIAEKFDDLLLSQVLPDQANTIPFTQNELQAKYGMIEWSSSADSTVEWTNVLPLHYANCVSKKNIKDEPILTSDASGTVECQDETTPTSEVLLYNAYPDRILEHSDAITACAEICATFASLNQDGKTAYCGLPRAYDLNTEEAKITPIPFTASEWTWTSSVSADDENPKTAYAFLSKAGRSHTKRRLLPRNTPLAVRCLREK
jgi:hypothetical protein